MVSVTKNGRRNCYRIHKKQNLRHDLEANCTLGNLVKLVNKQTKAHQSTVEAESLPVSKPRSIEPKPVEFKQEKPAPAKAETSKVKSVKSKAADSIERQQGSLF
jgi:hypothetical protein